MFDRLVAVPQYLSIICRCGKAVSAEVVAGVPNIGNTAWVRCPSCDEGSVRLKDGSVWPTAPAGGSVKNLPADVEKAWQEARTAHAVAAYTASEIMCRKILMHIAVDVAKAKPGDTFAAYIDALEKAGYITTGLKGTVDTIRQRGNIANHDLPQSTEDESQTTLGITELLLTTTYGYMTPASP
jgi:hypothetical protein